MILFCSCEIRTDVQEAEGEGGGRGAIPQGDQQTGGGSSRGRTCPQWLKWGRQRPTRLRDLTRLISLRPTSAVLHRTHVWRVCHSELPTLRSLYKKKVFQFNNWLFIFIFRFPYCSDVSSPYNSTYSFPNLANAAAVAAAAAAANNTSVSGAGGTSSVTTGANGGSSIGTNCTTDWPDYSGVDSTTSPFESRTTTDLGGLSETDQQNAVSISSGKT